MKKILGLAGGLLLLAGLLALFRLKQTTTEIPGAAVRFSPAHSLGWDPTRRLLTRTGDDPYGRIELPAACVPVQEVVIEFAGTPPRDDRSHFYVYQYPAYLEGVFYNDSYVVLGRPEPTPGGYRIRWQLANSKVVRLDLPDDLDQPCEILRIRIVSGFYGSWSATLMWTCLTAGLLLPLWTVLRRQVPGRPGLELGIFALLVALKLVLASDLRLDALGSAAHDDALFVTQADALRHGHWLGDFNERTLSKGPVYPLFLAAVGWSGAPLQPVQAGLHALACLLFVLALRPLLPSAGARLILFIVLLFDPHTLSSEAVGRVLRSGIQPALTLLLLAGAIGLATRITQPARRGLAWSLLAGLALPAFWYCREEGLWLVPSLALIGGGALVAAVRAGRTGLVPRLVLLVLPIALLLGSTWLLRTLNARQYGAPLTVDVKDGDFPRAYGALVRLTPAAAIPGVAVTRETQQRAAAVSPAFATIVPELEGPVGQGWARLGNTATGAVSDLAEIRSGWYQWALREAAAKAGHYRNAATATAYWARVADELNAAADAGRIAAGPTRTGFLPRWEPSLATTLRAAVLQAARVTVQFSDFTTRAPNSINSPSEAARFARITHQTRSPDEPPPGRLTDARVMVANLYVWCSPAVTAAALLAGLLVLGQAWRQRRGVVPVAILLALAGGATALMLVVALIDVTSFSAVHAMYLAPATPLVLAGWVLAPVWAWEFLPGRPAHE